MGFDEIITLNKLKTIKIKGAVIYHPNHINECIRYIQDLDHFGLLFIVRVLDFSLDMENHILNPMCNFIGRDKDKTVLR